MTNAAALLSVAGRLLGFGEPPEATAPAGKRESAREAAEGIRASQISMLLLLAIATIQLAAVVVTGSVGLLSDTIHNYVDALSGLPVWLALALGRRQASRRFSYGLHRTEDLAGLFIVVLILFSAGAAAYESTRRLTGDAAVVGHLPVALAGGIVGLIGNQAAAVYRIRVGRRIGSPALVADGYHARADALTSLAAVVGLVAYWAGFEKADPLAGLFVVALIGAALVREVLPGVGEHLLEGVNPELLDRAEAAAHTTAGVLEVSEARARWVGRRLRLEMVVTVDGERTVAEGHRIAVEAEHRVLHEVPEAEAVTIHVDPAGPEAHTTLEDHRTPGSGTTP